MLKAPTCHQGAVLADIHPTLQQSPCVQQLTCSQTQTAPELDETGPSLSASSWSTGVSNKHKKLTSYQS